MKPFYLPLSELAFERAHSVEEDDAVAMISFVKDAAGRKVADVQFELLSGDVMCANYNPRVALHLLIKPRKGQAALISNLLAFNVNYFRVYERMLLCRAIFVRYVHHEYPL